MKSTTKKILGAALVVPMMAFAVIGATASASAINIEKPRGTTASRSDLNATENIKLGTCVSTSSAETFVANGDDSECLDGSNNNLWDSSNTDPDQLIGGIVNIMLYIIGILCVVFIIWGGITYTMSRGDSKKVDSAKNTILYAVIGLIIALIAYALVNWVFNLFG